MSKFKTRQLKSLTFLKPADMEEGQTFEGAFLGSREDQYGGLGHKIQLTQKAVGISAGEEVKLASGEQIVINGCGTLDKLLEGIQKGQIIQVVYKGSQKIKGGKWKGKAAHQFEVGESEEFLEGFEASDDDEATPGKLDEVAG